MIRKLSKTHEPVSTLTPGFNQSTTLSIGGMSGMAGIPIGDKIPFDYVEEVKEEKKDEQVLDQKTKDVLNELQNLADDLEKKELEKEAQFFHFLIKKFADAEDYSAKFRELIIQVAASSPAYASELSIRLVEIYSEELKNQISQGVESRLAKKNAYEKALSYFPEVIKKQALRKRAQILQENPTYVAEAIYNVIDILTNRISMQSRFKAKPNIKKRIEQFNIFDISNKRAPGGAAIGVSIGLVKNVLNGQEPHFIQSVIDELAKLL